MSLDLSNPKRFLPLLLFIGFVFSLIGLGWWGFKEDSTLFWVGVGIMAVAVLLRIRERER